MTNLRRTSLYDLHLAAGAKMVPFVGWEMPVQYPMGVLGEHLRKRGNAGLFDVGHMGQVILRGDNVAHVLEMLVSAISSGWGRSVSAMACSPMRMGAFLTT